MAGSVDLQLSARQHSTQRNTHLHMHRVRNTNVTMSLCRGHQISHSNCSVMLCRWLLLVWLQRGHSSVRLLLQTL
jgi:hypothetical protein